jgi:hypothetical protein
MSGGVPACSQASCPGQRSYPGQSVISANTFVNNGGNVFLWQNSDRFCSAGFDQVCTLAGGGGGRSGSFTMSSCKSGLPSASVDPATYASRPTGSPARDWWNGCMWWTSNVRVTGNTVYFDPAKIAHCTKAAWPDCGAGGIFAEYGVAAPYNRPGGWAVLSQVTFFKNNTWSGNTYHGPSTFYAWNQGNNDNPVSWAEWTGDIAKGDKCSSADTRQSGACTGPFGQDAGSTYERTPGSAPPAPALSLAPAS